MTTSILKAFRLVLAFFVASVWVAASFDYSAAQIHEATGSFIDIRSEGLKRRAALGNELAAEKIEGRTLVSRDAIHAFYKERLNEPFWLSNSGVYLRAHQFLNAAEQAWQHGLNPHQYNAQEIRALIGREDLASQVKLELLLTDGFTRYIRDLSGMRVSHNGMKMDPEGWRQTYDAAAALSYLNKNKPMEDILESVLPKSKTYKALQKELIRLAQLPQEPYLEYLPISVKGLLRPGESHEAVPGIRARLGVQPQTSRERLYDDRLAAAVMKFQKENGLQDDGIIGPNTLQVLNRSNEQRKLQIIANLERLRWVKNDRPGRYVLVNIPSAMLWAIDDHKVAFEMPVIVGNPARPTLSFITQIQGVRLNPDWTIPPTIKRFDILPKLQDDPGYLERKGISLLQGYGRDSIELDPHDTNWHEISHNELHSFRMVQVPGDHNPLGRIRVLMNNKYSIYLHDTNKPHYFERPARALSSGCIRMKYPEKMAMFILQEEEGWSEEKMAGILASYRKTDLYIDDPIPVYLLYYTAWADEKGRVVYGNDVYNLDHKLIRKLSDIDGIPVPVHNEGEKVGSQARYSQLQPSR